MCCCKWCQYYLESIYWHCIEKHFCFDENIALYEDEEAAKASDTSSETNVQATSVSNNNIYDNMAFYDNVAMIANRSIFIIEPKDNRVASPTNYKSTQRPKSVHVDHSLHQEIFFDNDAKVITEQPKFSIAGSNSSLDLSKSEPDLTPPTYAQTKAKREAETFKNIPLITNTNTTSLSSLATISEDHEANPHLLSIPHSATSTGLVKMRKKSLHERRVSKSLTLDIDTKRQEVPIIRQSSFPKFYIDTPEANQNTSSIAPAAIQALETPVVANNFKFDLQTVVQLENERQEMEIQKINTLKRSVTSVKDNRRIQQIRDKLKPIKLLRNASMQSLYSTNG
ncbi:uncharacterized protein [Atheta coriaria]|uniref:uncharacterized protein isoform X1 n=1 Tax=Dalotia coriaria TaxID=877792 RepID=UPI0031F46BF2